MILLALLLALLALPARAQLVSLNQPGDTPCPAHLPIYGSAQNGAGDSIASCFPQLTNGSVLFAGTVAGNTGGITQDNAHLFWSGTALGVGTNSPGTTLDVNGDITDRGLLSCNFAATNGSGKFICHTPSCSIGAQSCTVTCVGAGCSDIALSCSVGSASCTVN